MNIHDLVDYSKPNEIALTKQNTLRILVGVLGVSLPLFLFLFLLIDSGYNKTLESISHYYYTRAAGLFVITLSLLAIFLIVYKGKQPIDFILSTTAGFFALLVVLFPTANISKNSTSYICSVTTLHPNDFRIKLHLFSAVIFLLALACMSLFVFTKSDVPREYRTKEKNIRNVFFRICGIIMIVAMLLAFLGSYNIINLSVFGESLVFWMETIAVESFGFAWLIKAEVFFKDKKPQSKGNPESQPPVTK